MFARCDFRNDTTEFAVNFLRQDYIAYYFTIFTDSSSSFITGALNSKDKHNYIWTEIISPFIVYNELDSISILLGDKILTISQLGGEIDSLIIIKENIEKEKKEFRSRAFTQINKLQGKVEGYKELLIAQDEEINKLKLINEQLYDENKDQKVEINTLNSTISEINKTKETLQVKVNYASRIELKNIEIFGISKNGRNYKNSFKNRLVNKIKIDIEIEENEIAKIELKKNSFIGGNLKLLDFFSQFFLLKFITCLK